MIHMVYKNNFKAYLLSTFLLTIGLLPPCSGSDKNAEKQAETPKAKVQKKNVTSPPKKVEKTDNKEWDALLEAARKEGKVVFAGPPNSNIRKGLDLFEAKYGIKVEFLSGTGSMFYPKFKKEYDSGLHTVDVYMGGVNTAVTQFLPADMIEPVKNDIILPDAGCGNWSTEDECPKFIDPDKKIVSLGNLVLGHAVYIYTKKIAPNEITSFDDLLNPKYKGKIAALDPVPNGPGAAGVNYLIQTKGAEFVKKLYEQQKIVYGSDDRQLSEWLARGAYDIVLFLGPSPMVQMIKEKLPVGVAYVKDVPGYTTGGFLGALSKMKKPPHPNAAKVLINWALTKEGLEMFAKALEYSNYRKDATNDWVPEFLRPQRGAKYIDTASWEHLTIIDGQMDGIRKQLFRK